MRIIMFRHHRHLHKINTKLFFTLKNVSQWYLVPHNCLQRNIDARYLIYVTKIKGSRAQAPIGKYLSLRDFRKSITASISNIFFKKTTVGQSSSHIQLGGNAEFLSHPVFLSVVRTTGNENFTDKFPFLCLGTNIFLSLCCLLAYFYFFNS